MTLFLSFVRHNGILWLNDGINKKKMESQVNIDIKILLRFVQKTINTLLSKTLSINKLYYFFSQYYPLFSNWCEWCYVFIKIM